MLIGTAGHIDHGKTALVRALTGVDADRLPEEADPPEISKVESDSAAIIWLNMRSATMDRLQLTDYAERYVLDQLSSLPGVAQVRLGGA